MTDNGKQTEQADVINLLDQRIAVLNQLTNNAFLGRSGFLKEVSGVTRDINKECKYPDTTAIKLEDSDDSYKELYDREAIAARVVEVMPKECWAVSPTVFETEDADEVTEFEQAWNNLSLSLTGESKFKQKDTGNPIWEYLQRADILSGIGHYGVLFLGLSDGKEMHDPAEPREGMELLFMRAFDQTHVDILEFELDPTNPRFGLPTFYSIDFSSPTDNAGGDIGVTTVTKRVHWTRVIHIADNIGSNEVFGTPRQRPVLNRLLDLRKIYAGSGEMYWQGAFPGLSFETHPNLGAVSFDEKSMKEKIQEYIEGLQRYIFLSGGSANSLAPQVVDPTPQIEAQIDAICIQLGIPKRIFLGSERGELSSSQDRDLWNTRLVARRECYVTPRIIVAFVDRLVFLGVLPEPEEYSVDWPDPDSQTEEEEARTALTKTEAMVKYVGGNVDSIMQPLDFFVRVLGMEPEEAAAIVEAAVQAMEEEVVDEGLETEELIEEPEVPEGEPAPELEETAV